MESSPPKEVIRRFFEAMNRGDVEDAVALIDPSFRGVDATRSAVTDGRQAARNEIRAGLSAFSDATFSVKHSVSTPSQVTVLWVLDAVQDCPFLQIPATNRRVQVGGVGFFGVNDGKIIRAIHLWDLAGLLRELGLLPDLPTGDRTFWSNGPGPSV